MCESVKSDTFVKIKIPSLSPGKMLPAAVLISRIMIIRTVANNVILFPSSIERRAMPGASEIRGHQRRKSAPVTLESAGQLYREPLCFFASREILCDSIAAAVLRVHIDSLRGRVP